MRLSILCALMMSAVTSHAAEQRIYQTDKYGNIQYQKPSYALQKDGRVVELDKFGNKQYQKSQYQIRGDRVHQTDKYGNIQYNKPVLRIK
jgi:acyl CoA:acetate/3-ketoacid CoA transferase alpha subunit